jgi:outer membrane protein OmpA-like peptidoglycan-associated protein
MKNTFKNLLATSIMLLAITGVFAQPSSADKAYRHYEYQAAIEEYTDLVKKNPNDGQALFNLANSYRLIFETIEAERWFAKAVENYDNPVAKLYYAQMLLTNGKYVKAQEWFNQFATVAPNSEDARRAYEFARFAKKLSEEGMQPGDYKVEKVPFNSEKLDFSPVMRNPQEMVFASNRDGVIKSKKNDPWTDDNFVSLFSVKINADGSYADPVLLPEGINSKLHEGPACFTDNGNTIYFTRSDYVKGKRGFDKNKNTRLQIYRSKLVEGEWETPVKLNFNSSDYSSCHPTLSKDGKMMIFASDRPGGFGDMDLYVTTWQDTAWTEPKNLGGQINTSGSEVFPFLGEDGHLYFASNFHVGFGGLDVFRARWKNEMWRDPVNLGAPINSNRDDFGFIANSSITQGYFTSNRAGSVSQDDIYFFSIDRNALLTGVVINCVDMQAIPGADVSIRYGGEVLETTLSNDEGRFFFNVPYGRIYLVEAYKEGYLKNSDCPGVETVNTEGVETRVEISVALPIMQAPLDGDVVQMVRGKVINAIYGNPIPKAEVKLINRCTGEDMTILSDENGNYSFPLKDECDYILIGDKDRFFPNSVPVTTLGKEDDKPIEADIPLAFRDPLSQGEDYTGVPGDQGPDGAFIPSGLTGVSGEIRQGTIIELFNVYFDLDKYNIRQDAIPYLEDLVVLLKNNPTMKGEISAHTDSRASYEYNIQLSNNRARSVYDYLLSRGIKADRLTWRGYGETQLKNDCADGVPCSEAQHQRNRRVEFKVTNFRGSTFSKEPDFIINRQRRDGAYDSTPAKQPEAAPSQGKFTVQLAAGPEPMRKFSDVPEVRRYIGQDGIIRITSGQFESQEAARAHWKYVVGLGFNDAWIAPLDENRQIEVAEER